MTNDAVTTTAADRRDALVERLFGATIGALELLSVHLGWRLGLYGVLAGSGPLTSTELAGGAGIDERYAREWLEQQAVAGLLEVDDVSLAPAARRYSLPPGHAEVLVDPDNAAYVAPFAGLVAGIGEAIPAVVEAYRTGGGVPFAAYGPDLSDGQAAINRPAFTNDLAGWFQSVPDVHGRFTSDSPARVADLGCGQGWSTLGIAAAYGVVQVDGFDLDEASIASAREHAAGHPASDRVSFTVGGSDALAASGPYDLVCIFEALHDMAQPVEALAAARAALAPGGSVLIADERVADAFTAPGDEIERMMYGWSITHCLPASRASSPSAALGTVLRAPTVAALATDAGFSRCEVLPIENDFFRFYRLQP